MIKNLISAMGKAVEALKKHPSQEVFLFHHNDTDGLTSGSILLNAFTQAGYTVSRFALEKPSPQVLEKVLFRKKGIIVRLFQNSVIFGRASGVFLTTIGKSLWHKELSKNSSDI